MGSRRRNVEEGVHSDVRVCGEEERCDRWLEVYYERVAIEAEGRVRGGKVEVGWQVIMGCEGTGGGEELNNKLGKVDGRKVREET